jgi:hypothetical protein
MQIKHILHFVRYDIMKSFGLNAFECFINFFKLTCKNGTKIIINIVTRPLTRLKTPVNEILLLNFISEMSKPFNKTHTYKFQLIEINISKKIKLYKHTRL